MVYDAIGDPDIPPLQRKHWWYVWGQIPQVAIPLQRGAPGITVWVICQQGRPSEARIGHGMVQLLMVMSVSYTHLTLPTKA